MSGKMKFIVFGFFCLVVTGWLTLVPAASSFAAGVALTVDDCAKCHDKEPQEIATKGAKHKTEISCISCHEGHRPRVANNIPECSNCHSGEPHFEVAACKSCHNPHSPLDITLKGEQKAVCLTCHGEEGQQLKANPSKHTEFACNFCHADKHGVIPQCVDCHEPHSTKMGQNDCNTCHQAHQPLLLTYGKDVPSVHCAACHNTAYEQLMASGTKHHELNCVFCHADKHKVVPACSDCHGLPHAEGMHKKFPKCGECHSTAHDLNNWAAKKEAAKKEAAKKEAPKNEPAKKEAPKAKK